MAAEVCGFSHLSANFLCRKKGADTFSPPESRASSCLCRVRLLEGRYKFLGNKVLVRSRSCITWSTGFEGSHVTAVQRLDHLYHQIGETLRKTKLDKRGHKLLGSGLNIAEIRVTDRFTDHSNSFRHRKIALTQQFASLFALEIESNQRLGSHCSNISRGNHGKFQFG